MAEYRLHGMPDDLPPGTYATRIKKAYWNGEGKPIIELELASDLDPADSLIKIVKANLNDDEEDLDDP